MDDESTIRRVAREALRAGQLPHTLPSRTWGGRGTGHECAICRTPVGQDEVELELEFVVTNGHQTTVSHWVHLQCFAAWELERHSLGASGLPTAEKGGTITACEHPSAFGRGPP
jgi:hypothetical protein